jgi:histidinol-phosphate phosphatase family protein
MLETAESEIDVVIPTLGRASLRRLLDALAPQRELLGQILVVDDRDGGPPLELGSEARVLAGRGRGPAAARNVGWRTSRAAWVAFLDDDVIPGPSWARQLQADLDGLGPATAGSQGDLRVPLPEERQPTDWERNVAALQGARWISADIAYRRRALAAVGGFDERFGGAYREDTDLAMRLLRRGWQIVAGSRRSEHPVAPGGFWVSVSRQRGNADDLLMRALHGRHWRRWGGAPRGRLRRHLLTAAAGLGAAAALAAGRRRRAALLGVAWLGLSAELTWARVAPGPREPAELGRMAATSAVLPFAASAWTALGLLRLPALLLRGGPRESREGPPPSAPQAVLFDRDGTLLVDVPYNGDPERVRPMPGAAPALRLLRERGLGLAVISNQSGIGRGLIEVEQVAAVNRRAEELLGPVGIWHFCPHAPEERCECRKPEPGLVLQAAARLGVSPDRCAVIGDIAADVQAAQAAGAAAVLVPTPRTQREDVRRAPRRAPTIAAAVGELLGEAGGGR